MDDSANGGNGRGADVSGGAAAVSIYSSDAVVVVPGETPLTEVAATIAAETVGCVVVGSAESVRGVVSERDIARLVGEGADLAGLTADHLGGRELLWVAPDSTVADVAVQMMQTYVRHALVGDGTRAEGIVSMRDLVAAYTT